MPKREKKKEFRLGDAWICMEITLPLLGGKGRGRMFELLGKKRSRLFSVGEGAQLKTQQEKRKA